MTIESVPNVSEGRRMSVVDSLARAVRTTAGVTLLDYSADAEHHRSVFTLAGDAGAVQAAILSLFEAAIGAIDLRQHRGEHPRIGAVDVIPFIPLHGATMDECVALAMNTAAIVGERFGVPVFLYEAAARTPLRRNLEDIRRGGFEGLAEKMRQPEWSPDFGPSTPHLTAGATVIGARMPLVAYNINLATDRIDVARRIAATIRQRGGGLAGVKALGLALIDRGIVQVSMNLTDYTQTSMPAAFDAVTRLAAEHGVDVLESELIGLAPADAFAGRSPASLKLANFTEARVLENAIQTASSSSPRREGAMPKPRILR
jgi:glutamate formiminotransferase / 5-formyltetrahydrofolate cyclo-ligase